MPEEWDAHGKKATRASSSESPSPAMQQLQLIMQQRSQSPSSKRLSSSFSKQTPSTGPARSWSVSSEGCASLPGKDASTLSKLTSIFPLTKSPPSTPTRPSMSQTPPWSPVKTSTNRLSDSSSQHTLNGNDGFTETASSHISHNGRIRIPMRRQDSGDASMMTTETRRLPAKRNPALERISTSLPSTPSQISTSFPTNKADDSHSMPDVPQTNRFPEGIPHSNSADALWTNEKGTVEFDEVKDASSDDSGSECSTCSSFEATVFNQLSASNSDTSWAAKSMARRGNELQSPLNTAPPFRSRTGFHPSLTTKGSTLRLQLPQPSKKLIGAANSDIKTAPFVGDTFLVTAQGRRATNPTNLRNKKRASSGYLHTLSWFASDKSQSPAMPRNLMAEQLTDTFMKVGEGVNDFMVTSGKYTVESWQSWSGFIQRSLRRPTNSDASKAPQNPFPTLPSDDTADSSIPPPKLPLTPPTYPPTPQTCSFAQHPANKLHSATFDVPLHVLFSLVFVDSPDLVIKPSHEQRETQNIAIGEWQWVNGKWQRHLKYSVCVNVLFSKSWTPCFETHQIEQNDDLQKIVLATSNQPQVPMGSTFRVQTQYCLTHDGPNRSKMETWLDVIFDSASTMTGAGMLRRKIQTASIENAKAYFQQLDNNLQDFIIKSPNYTPIIGIDPVRANTKPDRELDTTSNKTKPHQMQSTPSWRNKVSLVLLISVIILGVYLWYTHGSIRTERNTSAPSDFCNISDRLKAIALHARHLNIPDTQSTSHDQWSALYEQALSLQQDMAKVIAILEARMQERDVP